MIRLLVGNGVDALVVSGRRRVVPHGPDMITHERQLPCRPGRERNRQKVLSLRASRLESHARCGMTTTTCRQAPTCRQLGRATRSMPSFSIRDWSSEPESETVSVVEENIQLQEHVQRPRRERHPVFAPPLPVLALMLLGYVALT